MVWKRIENVFVCVCALFLFVGLVSKRFYCLLLFNQFYQTNSGRIDAPTLAPSAPSNDTTIMIFVSLYLVRSALEIDIYPWAVLFLWDGRKRKTKWKKKKKKIQYSGNYSKGFNFCNRFFSVDTYSRSRFCLFLFLLLINRMQIWADGKINCGAGSTIIFFR